MADPTTLDDFYRSITLQPSAEPLREIGRFDVFSTRELVQLAGKEPVMPYDHRTYYKVSLLRGRHRLEYADKVIDIEGDALLFATPKIPYHYVARQDVPDGHFCVFTEDFLGRNSAGTITEGLPIFQPGALPVVSLDRDQAAEVEGIFSKMHRAMASDYTHKYDLLLNYLMELIHLGQQLHPVPAKPAPAGATDRLASLFTELLERQFPISSPDQSLELRTPGDYAQRLSVHVNYLNRALKEHTGSTTSAIIHGRLLREAKILLRHSHWSISEIAYSLGFREAAHFSSFFKKYTALAPVDFRG